MRNARHVIMNLATIAVLLLCGCNRPTAESSEAVPPPAPPSNPMPTAPFLEAALEGSLTTIETALANGTPADACAEDGRTALMLSAFNGHTAIVKALLKAGAAISARDQTGRTALMYASTGPNPNTIETLLNAGANVNAVDGHERWSPLMFAAAEGHQDVVNLLLRHKADPTLKDTDGDSAAAFALQRGHHALAKQLKALEQGN